MLQAIGCSTCAVARALHAADPRGREESDAAVQHAHPRVAPDGTRAGYLPATETAGISRSVVSVVLIACVLVHVYHRQTYAHNK